MITIHNKQRKIPFDKVAMHRTVEKILTILKYENFDIGIRITNNKNIPIEIGIDIKQLLMDNPNICIFIDETNCRCTKYYYKQY